MQLNLTAMNSPYIFGFSDDGRVPEGRLKSKAMVQAAFTVMFRREEFEGKGDSKQGAGGEQASMLVGSQPQRVSESMLLPLRKDME